MIDWKVILSNPYYKSEDICSEHYWGYLSNDEHYLKVKADFMLWVHNYASGYSVYNIKKFETKYQMVVSVEKANTLISLNYKDSHYSINVVLNDPITRKACMIGRWSWDDNFAVQQSLQLALQIAYYDVRLQGLDQTSFKHTADYLKSNHMTIQRRPGDTCSKEDIGNMELQHLYDVGLIQ